MKRIALLLLALAGLSLAACAPRAPDPDRFAEKFFDHGKETIIDAIKEQNVSEAQLTAARSIFDRHESSAKREIAAAMRAQQELMLALTSGRDTASLHKLDTDQNKAQEQVLRTVGSLHEELASAVGSDRWKAISTQLEKKYRQYFKSRK